MSIVTATLLVYAPANRLRALGNMGRFFLKPFKADGLLFQKLLGSGIDYGMVPNLSTYAFLGVWANESVANSFLQSVDFQEFTGPLTDTGTLWLSPIKAHGRWDGINPFEIEARNSKTGNKNSLVHSFTLSPAPPIAVLTRATIRPRALPDFWRHVPQARQRLHDQGDALLFGIGVGELPLIQQCTISVWRDAQAVDQYAYRQSGHREVVRLTRQRQWYSEELFARFAVLRADGCFDQFINQAV